MLKDQMSLSMDTGAAGAFTGTDAKICFTPTSLTGGVWETDGGHTTIATANMTKDHLGCIRDYMANTIHAPFYDSEWYIGLFALKHCAA